MILQALYDYYQRKAADPENKVAPQGFEWKELPFIIIIDENGKFVHFEDTRTIEGNRKRAKKFLVPQMPGKRTSGLRANILWDNAEYIFALNNSDNKKAAFIQTIEKEADTSLPEIRILLKFLQAENNEYIYDPCWNEISTTNPFMSFRIAGHPDLLIGDVFYSLNSPRKSSDNQGNNVCLITGNSDVLEPLHTSIKGIAGTNTTGGSIVSFNLPAFCSFGKDQGQNAPVGKIAAFAYTTALNMLTDKDSENKFRIADMTVVFWAEKQTSFENQFPFFFTPPTKDDPDRNAQEVKALYESIHSGKINTEGNTPFYILGLAPNAARISIRLWRSGKVKEFADHIIQHFNDLEIVRGKKDERKYYSLFNLMSNIALEYKMDNVPPNLAGKIVECILDGSPYPVTLQQQCIRRIRAEQNINRIRAAILKGYLNRKNRIYKTNEKQITMSLDLENTNQGYLCGRLFAILEKIQEEAQPGINATIKDRYYGSASSTPIAVFGKLLSLSTHHLAKMNPGRKTNLEKLIQEVMSGISSNGMPAHLSLDEQSRFAIGYYHQRQDFFTKKEN